MGKLSSRNNVVQWIPLVFGLHMVYISANLRWWTLYQMPFTEHTGRRLEISNRRNLRKFKYMDIKQYASKQWMGKWRNYKSNLKVSWGKWKQKHNKTKLWNAGRAVLRGKCIVMNI